MQTITPPVELGFLGLGRMGGPMARNLVRAGFTVSGYDPDLSACRRAAGDGIAIGHGPAHCVPGAAALVLMLPSDDALVGLMEGENGLLAQLPAGLLVIDMATSQLATSQRLAALARERGVGWLDAPVSGGESGAQAGTLSIMVGGDPDDLARAEPVLQALGTTITHIGGNGMGLVAKYVNQLLMEASFCAIAEAFALASRAGADREAVFAAVRNGLGGSRVLELMVPQLLSGEMGSGRELALHHKDGSYVLAAAAALGVALPITKESHRLFSEAVAAGFAHESASAVARLYESEVGEATLP